MDLTDPFRARPRVLARLPRLVRLYIANCLVGFALAGIFSGLVLGLNIGNLGHLVGTVEGGWIAAVILFAFNGIVFSGVQTGIVVMTMDYGPE